MSSKQERPPETSVPLSNGQTVTVEELKWGAYRKLKKLVATSASGRIVEAVMSGRKPESAEEAQSDTEFMGTIVATILDVVDELTPVLIAGCTSLAAEEIEGLKPSDVLSLRNDCAKVNDLARVFDLEKNALAAAMSQFSTIAAGLNVGGLSSSPKSPPPTDGVVVE